MVDGGCTPSNCTGGIHYNENQYVQQKEYIQGGEKGQIERKKEEWIRGVSEEDKKGRDYY